MRFYVRRGVEALVVRGLDVVARAAPAGTREWASAQGTDAQALASLPDCVRRCIVDTGIG